MKLRLETQILAEIFVELIELFWLGLNLNRFKIWKFCHLNRVKSKVVTVDIYTLFYRHLQLKYVLPGFEIAKSYQCMEISPTWSKKIIVWQPKVCCLFNEPIEL